MDVTVALFLDQDREEQSRREGQDELQQLDDERRAARRLPSPLLGGPGAAAGAPSAALGPPSAGQRALAGVAVLCGGRRRGHPAAEAAELLHQRDPGTATGRRERQHQQEEAGR